jgi:hypothetical protein
MRRRIWTRRAATGFRVVPVEISGAGPRMILGLGLSFVDGVSRVVVAKLTKCTLDIVMKSILPGLALGSGGYLSATEALVDSLARGMFGRSSNCLCFVPTGRVCRACKEIFVSGQESATFIEWSFTQ